jgi:hypothetical protein
LFVVLPLGKLLHTFPGSTLAQLSWQRRLIDLTPLTSDDGRQTQAALEIARGTCRCLLAHAFAALPEVTLATGRRADLMAVNAKGDIWIVEIKSSRNDFRTDQKWPDYRAFCDRFFFAVAPDFPREILPGDAGLILADRYGADIARMPEPHALAGARRKAVLITFGLTATRRLHSQTDPAAFAP